MNFWMICHIQNYNFVLFYEKHILTAISFTHQQSWIYLQASKATVLKGLALQGASIKNLNAIIINSDSHNTKTTILQQTRKVHVFSILTKTNKWFLTMCCSCCVCFCICLYDLVMQLSTDYIRLFWHVLHSAVLWQVLDLLNAYVCMYVNMYYLLLFHDNSGFADTPQRYVIRTLPVVMKNYDL
jgi:hypothetical protein